MEKKSKYQAFVTQAHDADTGTAAPKAGRWTPEDVLIGDHIDGAKTEVGRLVHK